MNTVYTTVNVQFKNDLQMKKKTYNGCLSFKAWLSTGSDYNETTYKWQSYRWMSFL